jgi:hypothetical protein
LTVRPGPTIPLPETALAEAASGES